jgi:UDP-N-acetylmuramate dehydrogenase
MSQHLKRLWVITPQLQTQELTAAEINFAYRHSTLLNFPHWLVVEAEFALTKAASAREIQTRTRHLMSARRARQPTNPKSCGSIFKNPPTGPGAGFLIDQAGFKGQRLGDAQVSRKHANYILNQGQATGSQIKQLIGDIQAGVREKFGITLEREVVFLPDDHL